jgi:hypothetical protein
MFVDHAGPPTIGMIDYLNGEATTARGGLWP